MGRQIADVEAESLDRDELRALLLRDAKVFKYAGGREEILSKEDLAVLCDRYVFFFLAFTSGENRTKVRGKENANESGWMYRSDQAYEKAAKGEGNAAGFEVVETGANGVVRAGGSGEETA